QLRILDVHRSAPVAIELTRHFPQGSVLEDDLMFGPREGLTHINRNRLRWWTLLVNAYLKPGAHTLHVSRYRPQPAQPEGCSCKDGYLPLRDCDLSDTGLAIDIEARADRNRPGVSCRYSKTASTFMPNLKK